MDELQLLEENLIEIIEKFKKTKLISSDSSIAELAALFPFTPCDSADKSLEEYTAFLTKNVIPHCVNLESPRFVGHMVTSIPAFMPILNKITGILHQNVVKVETSKVFTLLEQQILATLHHLVFKGDNTFYEQLIHHPESNLGALCSGGTLGNLLALWSARNRFFSEENVRNLGIAQCLSQSNLKGLVVIGSEGLHYSLSKVIDILGIGRKNLIALPTNESFQIDCEKVKAKGIELKNKGYGILAVVGIAGTTETGAIDPLEDLAGVAEELDCHYHVDAAWGGPTLYSQTHKGLLKGIEHADTVVIDGHKQLHTTMGHGIVLYKDPQFANAISTHANYIIRKESKDLGKYTIEGSRAAHCLNIHAGLNVIGQAGYARYIDRSIALAQKMADIIKQHDSFELISAPRLNIFTYRFSPKVLEDAANERNTLNLLVRKVQQQQWESGYTFVSRTTLKPVKHERQEIDVFRVVVNPETTSVEYFQEILEHQLNLLGQS